MRSSFGDNWLFDSFHGGQKPKRGRIFFTYLILGIISYFWWPIIFVALIPWIMGFTGFKRLTLRSWMASVLGIITPHWIMLGIGYIY